MKLKIVDNINDRNGRVPGALKRVGGVHDQDVIVRCPACARKARFPIFPKTNSQDRFWTAEMGERGMSLEPEMVFQCCGWAGRLSQGDFVPLDETAKADEHPGV